MCQNQNDEMKYHHGGIYLYINHEHSQCVFSQKKSNPANNKSQLCTPQKLLSDNKTLKQAILQDLSQLFELMYLFRIVRCSQMLNGALYKFIMYQ